LSGDDDKEAVSAAKESWHLPKIDKNGFSAEQKKNMQNWNQALRNTHSILRIMPETLIISANIWI
jgi:hypothetical protein